MEEVLLIIGSDALCLAVVLVPVSTVLDTCDDINVSSLCLASAGACCLVVRKDKAEKTSSSSEDDSCSCDGAPPRRRIIAVWFVADE